MITTKAFEDKKKLIAIMDNIPQVLDKERLNCLKDALQNLKDDKFPIVFAGRFSVGKSMLINRLFLSEDILPNDINPSTVANLIITKGKERCFKMQRGALGEEQEKSITDPTMEQIRDFTNKNGDNLGDYQQFVLELPDVDVLQEGVSIVDTVGTEDIDDEYVNQTINYIEQAAVVVYITDARQPLTDSEIKFLTNNLGGTAKQIFIAANKSDGRSEDDLKLIREDLGKRVAKLWDSAVIRGEKHIFTVSAKKKYGLENFRNALISYIAKNRVRELVGQTAEKSVIVIRPYIEELEHDLNMLQKKKKEKNDELELQQQQLAKFEEAIREKSISADEDEIINIIEEQLEGEIERAKNNMQIQFMNHKVDKNTLAHSLAQETNSVFKNISKVLQNELKIAFKRRISKIVMTNNPEEIHKHLKTLGMSEIASMVLPVTIGGGGVAIATAGSFAIGNAFLAAEGASLGVGSKIALWWGSGVAATQTGAIYTATIASAPYIIGGVALIPIAWGIKKYLDNQKLRKTETLINLHFDDTLTQAKEKLKNIVSTEFDRFEEKLEQDIEQEKKKIEAIMSITDIPKLEKEINQKQKAVNTLNLFLNEIEPFCLTVK